MLKALGLALVCVLPENILHLNEKDEEHETKNEHRIILHLLFNTIWNIVGIGEPSLETGE